MKMNKQDKPRGSFGIPEEMLEASKRQASQQPLSKSEETPEQVNEEDGVPEAKGDALPGKVSPLKTLSDLGVNFTEDNLQELVLYGKYSAEVDVVKGILKATFRMLTTEDYDGVDDFLGEELENNRNLTYDMLNQRRSVWTIAYGVTHLNGKLLVKPEKDGKQLTSKELAQERKKVFSRMPALNVNKLIRIHGTIHTAISLIGEDPELLKNS